MITNAKIQAKIQQDCSKNKAKIDEFVSHDYPISNQEYKFVLRINSFENCVAAIDFVAVNASGESVLNLKQYILIRTTNPNLQQGNQTGFPPVDDQIQTYQKQISHLAQNVTITNESGYEVMRYQNVYDQSNQNTYQDHFFFGCDTYDRMNPPKTIYDSNGNSIYTGTFEYKRLNSQEMFSCFAPNYSSGVSPINR